VTIEGGGELWRIGRHSDGPGQFGAWREGLRYSVGDDLREFPASLPGPFSSSTGHRPAEFAVDFERPASSSGFLAVRLEVYANGACPALDFELNGHAARVHPTPRRDIAHGYLVPASPFAGWATVEAAFPAAHLVDGPNVLVVRTVAPVAFDPVALLEARPSAPGGASLTLTELVLRESTESTTRVTVRALPLFLHESDGGGELFEIVVARPLWDGPLQGTLTVGDVSVPLLIDPDGRAHGEVLCRVAVAPPDGEVAWTVRLADERGGEAIEQSGSVSPCRRWTLHVVPHSHLDLGYTDHAPKALDIHARNIDRVLAVGLDDDRFALALDGSIVAERYLLERSAPARAEFLAAVKSGAISVNAFYAQFLTGTPSIAEWYRGVRFALELAAAEGLPSPVANITDVPVYSSALPSILAAAGLDRFVGMTNHCRAVNDDSDKLHLASPFRWAGPDGAEVLAFFGNNYAQLADIAGRAWTLEGTIDTLSRLTGLYERPDYLPDHLPILGTHSDNDDLDPWPLGLVEAWNAAFAAPRLQFDTFAGYLDAVEPLRDSLPLVRGEGGGYWEEGLGAAARETADYRWVQSALPAAEAAAVMAGLSDDRLAIDLASLEAAWNRVLIAADHTWTADNVATLPSSSQAEGQLRWQRAGLTQATQHTIDLARSALGKLAENVATERPCLIVVNPSSWQRPVEIELELRRPVRLTLDGAEVPLAILDTRLDTRRARAIVPDVPPFGYAVLEIESDPAAEIPDVALTAPPLLRNPHWLMGVWPAETDDVVLTTDALEPLGFVVQTDRWEAELDGGRIIALRHRATGADLVAADSPYGFAEVFRVVGGGSEQGRGFGDEITNLWSKDLGLAAPDLAVEQGVFEVRGLRRLPWGMALRVRGSAPTLPSIELEIVLRDDEDRIDVVVELDKVAAREKESVYVAFPFTTGGGRLSYERQVGWVDPEHDFLPGACFEWHTAQNAVCLGRDDDEVVITWVPVDAPLFSVGDVVRSEWPDAHRPAGPGVFSWVMNNWWWTNFAASQSGRVVARYSLTVGRSSDRAASARFARSRREPGLVGEVTPLDKRLHGPRPLALPRGRVLDLDLDRGLVASVSSDPAGTGRGLLRVLDTAGAGGRATLRWPGTVSLVTATGADPRPLPADEGAFHLEIEPWGQRTLRLEGGERS
jgi:alpha-mannosidase